MDTISAQGSSHKKKDKEKASTDLKAGGGGGGGGVEGSRDEVVLPARATWGHFVPGSSSPLHPGRLHRCLVLQGAQVVPGVQDEKTEELMLTNEGFFQFS